MSCNNEECRSIDELLNSYIDMYESKCKQLAKAEYRLKTANEISKMQDGESRFLKEELESLQEKFKIVDEARIELVQKKHELKELLKEACEVAYYLDDVHHKVFGQYNETTHQFFQNKEVRQILELEE